MNNDKPQKQMTRFKLIFVSNTVDTRTMAAQQTGAAAQLTVPNAEEPIINDGIAEVILEFSYQIHA